MCLPYVLHVWIAKVQSPSSQVPSPSRFPRWNWGFPTRIPGAALAMLFPHDLPLSGAPWTAYFSPAALGDGFGYRVFPPAIVQLAGSYEDIVRQVPGLAGASSRDGLVFPR